LTETLPDRARQLLANAEPVVLTTLNPDGTPHSTPVWAMCDGDEVVMSTLTKRAKFRNVSRDPRVSVVLLDPVDPLKYVTVSGSVRLVPDEDKAVLNDLSRLYLGTPYPIDEGPRNVRVTLRLRPDRAIGQTEAAR
jgi:PPOX class probable F420-dependent enzyme